MRVRLGTWPPFYSAKHDTNAWTGLESGDRGSIMTLRHKILVVEEVHEPAAGLGPAEIAHHARKAAGQLRAPKVAHQIGKLARYGGCGTFGAVVDDNQLDLGALFAGARS